MNEALDLLHKCSMSTPCNVAMLNVPLGLIALVVIAWLYKRSMRLPAEVIPQIRERKRGQSAGVGADDGDIFGSDRVFQEGRGELGHRGDVYRDNDVADITDDDPGTN